MNYCFYVKATYTENKLNKSLLPRPIYLSNLNAADLGRVYVFEMKNIQLAKIVVLLLLSITL